MFTKQKHDIYKHRRDFADALSSNKELLKKVEKIEHLHLNATRYYTKALQSHNDYYCSIYHTAAQCMHISNMPYSKCSKHWQVLILFFFAVGILFVQSFLDHKNESILNLANKEFGHRLC